MAAPVSCVRQFNRKWHGLVKTFCPPLRINTHSDALRLQEKRINEIYRAALGRVPKQLMRVVSAYEVDFMTYWMACDITRMPFFYERLGRLTPNQFLNLPRLKDSPNRHANFATVTNTHHSITSDSREDAQAEIGTQLLPEAMIDERGHSHGIMLSQDGLSLSILNLTMDRSDLVYTRITIAVQSVWKDAIVNYRWARCREKYVDSYNYLSESFHTRITYDFLGDNSDPLNRLAYYCAKSFNGWEDHKTIGRTDLIGPYVKPSIAPTRVQLRARL